MLKFISVITLVAAIEFLIQIASTEHVGLIVKTVFSKESKPQTETPKKITLPQTGSTEAPKQASASQAVTNTVIAAPTASISSTSASSTQASSNASVQSSAKFLGEQSIENVPANFRTLPLGVDLSRWQGIVDFADLKSRQIAFIFVKATQGASYVDPLYRNNVQQARLNQIRTGSYHFYDADDSPAAQFDNFSKNVSFQNGDLFPVIDIETVNSKKNLAAGQLAADVKQFADLIFKKWGVKPIIYTNPTFANAQQLGVTLGEFPLWIAEYGVEAPRIPTGWKNWVMWQYTSSASIQGVNGYIDMDLFNSKIDSLGRYTYKTTSQKQ